MKMDISGLLQDQMISYYPLGNFLFHLCMSMLTDHQCSGVNLLLAFINFCHMFYFPVTELGHLR